MSHLPFFKFYPADWLQDTQILTLEAKGAWINILCAMWVAPERGSITFKKRDLNVFLTNISDDEIHQITVDLDNVADIEWRDSDGNIAETWEYVATITFKSRRMIREEVKRKQGLDADRRYRVSKTSMKRHKNVPETSKIYQKSEVRSHISEVRKKKNKRAQVELPAWLPLDNWNGFLEYRKRIRKPLTDRGITLAINILGTLKNLGNDPGSVLDQSVTNGWTGLFELKNGGANGTDRANQDRQSHQPEPKGFESVRGFLALHNKS